MIEMQRELVTGGANPVTREYAPPNPEVVSVHADLSSFADRFKVKIAETAEDVDRCFKLRHQVYCIERGFEKLTDFPDGRESDPFDRHSVHALLIDTDSDEALGTARLVLPNVEKGLPLSSIAPGLAGKEGRLPTSQTCEISRFCLSKTIRASLGRDAAAVLPFLPMGLIRGLIALGEERDLSHVCAVMEPALLRLLTRLGIRLNPWGELVDHHGLRQPCWGGISSILNTIRVERPDVWSYCTKMGHMMPGAALAEAAH